MRQLLTRWSHFLFAKHAVEFIIVLIMKNIWKRTFIKSKEKTSDHANNTKDIHSVTSVLMNWYQNSFCWITRQLFKLGNGDSDSKHSDYRQIRSLVMTNLHILYSAWLN